MAENPKEKAPPAVRKLTRREVSGMSTMQFLAEALVPAKRLYQYVHPYRSRFFTGVAFGILAGLFNAVMIFGMKYVFEIVLDGNPGKQSVTVPMIDYKINLPQISLDGDNAIWVVIGVSMIIPFLMLIRGLLGYLQTYCMMWVGQKVLYDLRSTCFTRLMRQSLSFYSKQKAGELIQTVFNQTRMAASTGSDLAANLVKHPISMIAIVGTLFYIDWIFAICALVVFPLCLLPVIYVSKKVRKAGGKEEEEAGALMVLMQEAFSGVRVVKSHAREDYEIKRFNSASKLLEQLIMRWKKAIAIVGPLVETVASLGIAAGLAYAWATEMTSVDFLIRYAALIALYPHAKALSQLQVQLQKTIVATTKVFEVIDRPLEIDDKPDAIALEGCRGAIELENVSFEYKKGIPALVDINLKMDPGKTYALVGQSGAGKSTLFSLLLRFYDPDKGTVKVDGHDIRDIQQTSLRDQIGIVNQDTFLFHDTVFNNIRYGNLNATKEEVYAAAEQAHAHDFILAQENGYETVVGDKGGNLSGGQQQRITIARAFVRNAPILLLDEATSALDSEAEHHIQRATELLSRGKTVIAIAHRLSTILQADAIVMMKDGKIIDIAPHAELLGRCKAYKKLYDLQFEGQARAIENSEPS